MDKAFVEERRDKILPELSLDMRASDGSRGTELLRLLPLSTTPHPPIPQKFLDRLLDR